MRTLFPGYYKPTPQDFDAMWQDCIFAFDANVLLNVYRYTPTTQERLIDILQKLGDRIWVPYQAAFEYQEQRLEVISQQLKAYEEIEKTVRESLQSVITAFNKFQRHPFLNFEEITKPISEAVEATIYHLQKLQSEHPNLLTHDPLLEKITNLFEGKVGGPYTKQRRDEIHKQAEQRFKEEIPPGYKDKGKDGQKQSGDVVVWFQIIDHAKAQQKPIIFVTDDHKEDWWLKHKGKTVGPRPELIQEILSEAGVTFYMYQTDQFMDYAEKFLHLQEQPAAIAEVREVREQDEVEHLVEDAYFHLQVSQASGLASPSAISNWEHTADVLRDALAATPTAPGPQLDTLVEDMARSLSTAAAPNLEAVVEALTGNAAVQVREAALNALAPVMQEFRKQIVGQYAQTVASLLPLQQVRQQIATERAQVIGSQSPRPALANVDDTTLARKTTRSKEETGISASTKRRRGPKK